MSLYLLLQNISEPPLQLLRMKMADLRELSRSFLQSNLLFCSNWKNLSLSLIYLKKKLLIHIFIQQEGEVRKFLHSS